MAPYFYRPDLGYQIWQEFRLTQEANAGDPLAQHELGLRYLMGEGIPADTSQAVYWIKKAAEQNLTSAKYNYAILLINGIGVEWNPFTAFKYFRSAADDGMVQAEFVMGILYTDNLITNRNWDIAYYWIKKSAEGDYEPAAEVLPELKPKISLSAVDSLFKEKKSPDLTKPVSDPEENLTSSLGLVFIDFDALSDSVAELKDSMIVSDLELVWNDSSKKKIDIDSSYTLNSIAIPSNIEALKKLAEIGCPEAQTILGRMYEKGIYFKKDIINAAAYYYRALRNDSPKAIHLLWKMAQSKELMQLVQSESENGNNIAGFVWYGLNSTGFDRRIALNDALNLLNKSAQGYYLPAMMELGLNYYTGKFVQTDKFAGINIWKSAAQLGSKEAEIRIIASRLFDSPNPVSANNDFKELLKAAEDGSLFAMVSVALCYRDGIGTKRSKPDAVKYFRLAAQRGNQFAYEELKNLYDEIRPADKEFLIVN